MQQQPPVGQTSHEERANALSHGLGCLLALLALPAVAQQVDAALHPVRHLGLLVFLGSMLLMYGVSAVYHAAPAGQAKRWLQKCDHAMIFGFIAGSWTPFGLAAVQRGEPLALLVAVWGAAVLGMGLKLADRLRHRGLSTALYLAFGWAAAALAQPVLASMPADGLWWLVAGGLAYSLGSLFYLLDERLRYSHLVWHLFVITGSCCHLVAVQQLR